jgi:hypothetical protein
MCGVLLFVVTVAIYVSRLNDAAGLMVDDGYYVMLARALSQGEGYRLVNSAATAVVPLYPPGFPAILSIAFHLFPAFPQNAWLLKCVSIAAMFGVGLLTYAYARTRQLQREPAACVAVAVTITPAFVFLATSTVMSECVFTLFQLATVLLIHRGVDANHAGRTRKFMIAAALTAAATVFVRTAGLGLVLASGVWLLKERLWKQAVLFGAIAVVCVLPWMLYARAYAPTGAEQALHGGSIVYSYGEQIWMRWAGDPGSGTATLADLPKRVGVNTVDVFGRGMGGLFVPALFRGPAESGEEMVALGGAAGLSRGSMGGVSATMAISLLLSAIVLLGFAQTARTRVTLAELFVPVSLGITLLWPFWTFRFVIPLAPFLFVYLVAGIRTLAPPSVVRIALLCVIGLHVSDHARYVLAARDPARANQVSWLAQAHETEEVLEWAARHLGDGVIATTNPALVYLRTGQKTLSFDRPLEDWSVWRSRGVRYVVCLVPIEPPLASHGGSLLYRSASGFWIIET